MHRLQRNEDKEKEIHIHGVPFCTKLKSTYIAFQIGYHPDLISQAAAKAILLINVIKRHNEEQ